MQSWRFSSKQQIRRGALQSSRCDLVATMTPVWQVSATGWAAQRLCRKSRHCNRQSKLTRRMVAWETGLHLKPTVRSLGHRLRLHLRHSRLPLVDLGCTREATVAGGSLLVQLQRKQAAVALAAPQLQAPPMVALAWSGHEGLQRPRGLLPWDHRHQGNGQNCLRCRLPRQTGALIAHQVRPPGLGVVAVVVAAQSLHSPTFPTPNSAFGRRMRSAGRTYSVVAAQTRCLSAGQQITICTNPEMTSVRCRTIWVVPSVSDALVHQLGPRIQGQHRHRVVPTVHHGLIVIVNARLQFTSAFTRTKMTADAGWTRHGSGSASRRRRTSA
mmetsp:Transcript_96538/g.191330  ORF Transcript_96538/g.191330 Transcript_96538/m.191330 type:complete len:327 (+) Transcript_96538:401-1381(+)